MEEVIGTAEAKDKMISILNRKIENSESSERDISDLKAELVKQTELARKNHNNNQRLTIERDKCVQLNSCKDALIKDYQNAIKLVKLIINSFLNVCNLKN